MIRVQQLQTYLAARTPEQTNFLRDLRLDGPPSVLALDLDGASDRANMMRIERRRDALESRRRWQFGLTLRSHSWGKRMTELFLSRVSLRTDPSVATLAPILFDAAGRHRSEASRRLVWTLFADSEDRKRDFLWREDDARRFYVLSTSSARGSASSLQRRD